MTPPAGQGQRNVLKTHYDRIGQGPVAYVDETYHVETDGRRRFYVMAAAVVLEQDATPCGPSSTAWFRTGGGTPPMSCEQKPAESGPDSSFTRSKSPTRHT